MEFEIESLFPEITSQVDSVYSVFSAIAVVIIFAALLRTAFHSSFGDVGALLKTIVVAAIQAIAITLFPSFADLLQDLGKAALAHLDAAPGEVHLRFAKLMVGDPANADGGEEIDMLDILLSDSGGLGSALLYAIVFLTGKIAWLIMWLGYVIQQFLLIYGVAVAPVFVAMSGLSSTSGIASRYFLGLLGVIAWPLGWALASMMTEALLDFAVNREAVGVDGSQFVYSSQTFFVVLLVSIWVLLSTIATPKLISHLIQHGSQIGASLLGSVGTGLSRGAAYGISAATTTSVAGASNAQTAASAAIGGFGGMISGAAGTSGSFGSAAIGSLAVTALGNPPEVHAEAAEIARKQRK